MIVVEGPDGAGKTTLCRELLDAGVTARTVLSPGRTRLQSGLTLFEESLRVVNNSQERDAVDRFFFSELIYGPILRQAICFTPEQCMTMTQKLQNHIVVFCLPLKLNLAENETNEVRKRISVIYSRYTALWDIMRYLHPHTFRYTWDKPDSWIELKSNILGAL